MQYYFDVRRDGQTNFDDDADGTELPDVQAAREEAVASIREILAEALQSGEESREGEMIVKDQAGETVATVRFSMRVRLG
jgi:hypothetical protein